MSLRQEDDQRIAERASQYLGVLLESNQERCAFFDWLAESPRNVEVFLSTLRTAGDIADITPEQLERIERLAGDAPGSQLAPANVVHLTEPLPSRLAAIEVGPKTGAIDAHRSRRGLVRAAGLAATLVLLLAGVWFARPGNPHLYATAIGEQRSFKLADGSVVHLNTHSQLKVEFTGNTRSLWLAGEALFNVERDPHRPFRVYAGDAVIQAIGTQFDVYQRPVGTHVSVLQGMVQISSDRDTNSPGESEATESAASLLQGTRLAGGEEADIAAGGAITRRGHVDLEKAIAWRQRRLVFEGQTLENIAAEFNRYNPTLRIRVIGSGATQQHFSGTFEADDPETLMKALAGYKTLIIERTGTEIVVKGR